MPTLEQEPAGQESELSESRRVRQVPAGAAAVDHGWSGTPPPAAREPGRITSRTGPGWIVAALVSAVLACAWIAFVPTVRDNAGKLVFDESGQLIAEYDEETFIQAHGAWVILLFPIPIALAAVPLARGGDTRTTAVYGTALGGVALVGSFSVGLYFVPSALMLLIGSGLAEWRSFRQRL